jgi:hypothetical protein
LSNPKPERENIEPLPIQTIVGAILRAIAAKRPKRGTTLSESMLVVRGIGSREAVQLALGVLCDFTIIAPVIGPAGRTTTLFRFEEAFSPSSVEDVLAWDGFDRDCVDECEAD